jgi:DNA polymerase V
MSSFDGLPNIAPVGRDATATPAAKAPTGSAGFGSPGADATVRRLDLNEALIRHPQATFMMRVAGTAMRGAGIDDGDVVLVDRALEAHHGQVVVAVVEGELVCRRLFRQGTVVKLESVAPDLLDQVVPPGEPLEIWGVVTTVIKSLLG